MEKPFRAIRLDLESMACPDPDVDVEFGDMRLTVRRKDWTVLAELDVYTYDLTPPEDAGPLDESF